MSISRRPAIICCRPRTRASRPRPAPAFPSAPSWPTACLSRCVSPFRTKARSWTHTCRTSTDVQGWHFGNGGGHILAAAVLICGCLSGMCQAGPAEMEKLAAAQACSGCDLSGDDLTGLSLTHVNLTAADLSGARLDGLSLIGSDLSGADLTDASLVGTTLGGVILTEADLTGADLTGAVMVMVQSAGAIYDDADLTDALAPTADFEGASFRNARLANAD